MTSDTVRAVPGNRIQLEMSKREAVTIRTRSKVFPGRVGIRAGRGVTLTPSDPLRGH